MPFGSAAQAATYWPPACVVLGFVLGQIIEANFARAMRISRDDWTTFFTRPVSLILFLAMVFFLVSPYIPGWYRRLTGKAVPADLDQTIAAATDPE